MNVRVVRQALPGDNLARYHHNLSWGDQHLSWEAMMSADSWKDYTRRHLSGRIRHVLEGLVEFAVRERFVNSVSLRSGYVGIYVKGFRPEDVAEHHAMCEAELVRLLGESYYQQTKLWYSTVPAQSVEILPDPLPLPDHVMEARQTLDLSFRLPDDHRGHLSGQRGSGLWQTVRMSQAARCTPEALRLIARLIDIPAVSYYMLMGPRLSVGVGLAYDAEQTALQLEAMAGSLQAAI